MAPRSDKYGQALGRVLQARESRCSRDDAARVADLLLDLIAAGVLRAPDPIPAPIPGSQPKTAPRSGVVGSENRVAERDGENSPIVYNMGLSNHQDSES